MVDQARSIESGKPAKLDFGSFRGGFSGRERDVLFYNVEQPRTFAQLAYGFGLDSLDDGRAVAAIDFDGDGDLDLAVSSLQRLRLMQNNLPRRDRHFARVDLVATKTQHHALGAVATVKAGGVSQRRMVRLTSGFKTQVLTTLHFGLGAAPSGVIDELVVEWPSGGVERFVKLPIDRRIRVVEGTAAPTVTEVNAWPASTREVPSALNPHVDATPVAGGRAPLGARGTPLVVNFWAPWCKPCKAELPQLSKLSRTYRGQIDFAGVSVEMKDIASVKAAIAAFRLPYAQFVADETLLAAFFGPDGGGAVPSTFVFDGAGRVRRIFSRSVGRGDLVGLLDSLLEERPSVHDHVDFGLHKMLHGQLSDARTEFEAALALQPDSAQVLMMLGDLSCREGDCVVGETLLRRAVAADPNYAQGHFQLGLALRRDKRLAESARSLERAVGLLPSDAVMVEELALTYVTAERDNDALRAHERLVELRPNSAMAWWRLALVRRALGDPKTVQALQEVLRIDPSHQGARGAFEAMK